MMSNTPLDELRNQMHGCNSCDLHKCRSNVVFGTGSTRPIIMFIGEGPGDQEDEFGVPFVGQAGTKLDKILNFIGVGRDEVFLTNAVLCKSPNGRNPKQDELDACRWRLTLQIQLLQPALIVVLGKVAMSQLIGKPIKGALTQFFPENLKDHENGWLTYQIGKHNCKVLCTYHPSYLLRAPERGYRITLPHWKKIKRFVERQRVKIANEIV